MLNQKQPFERQFLWQDFTLRKYILKKVYVWEHPSISQDFSSCCDMKHPLIHNVRPLNSQQGGGCTTQASGLFSKNSFESGYNVLLYQEGCRTSEVLPKKAKCSVPSSPMKLASSVGAMPRRKSSLRSHHAATVYRSSLGQERSLPSGTAHQCQ